MAAELRHRRQDLLRLCVYIAPNKEMVERHAREGGFPANRISEVRTTIDPTTAEG
jgi:hypothetical protein